MHRMHSPWQMGVGGWGRKKMSLWGLDFKEGARVSRVPCFCKRVISAATFLIIHITMYILISLI